MNQVDFFLRKQEQWLEEFTLLRAIILETELTEDFKWMHPCYTLNDENVVLIHGFKKYCALLFHKGVLLNDTENILVQQTKNVQAARQLRFTTSAEIKEQRDIIKRYVVEAIDIAKSGAKVPMKTTEEYEIPDELKFQFAEDNELEVAFKALTPGRQRGYLLFFGQAKQAKTRIARIEKNIPKIKEGKGLNE